MAVLNSILPCRICMGRQKTRCMICGHKAPKGAKKSKKKPKYEWTHEDYVNEWLYELWCKMAKYNMASTGDERTDSEIIAKFGPWPRVT